MGKKKRRPGWSALYVELPDEQSARLRAFCESRNERVSEVIREALERHMASPPTRVVPPLEPPTTSQTVRT